MLRAPWTIWRSTSAEVLRTLLLATLALVALIAFIGAVRPLAEGRIGLLDALRLTALLAVPMLQYTLPFAAGFAATLGYHRAASENETTAAHAVGIAHSALLIPALALGLLLAASLWTLSNHTIPVFLNRAEGLIQRDLARIVLAPLQRGETIRIGNFDIHADHFIGPIDPPPGSSATASIALYNVLAVQSTGSDGVAYASDERIDLWLFDDPQDPNSTVVQFAFTRPEFVSPSGSLSVRALLSKPYRFPRTVADDPKFLSYPDLLRLRAQPDRSPTIRRHTQTLAATTASAAMIEHIATALDTAGTAELLLPEGAIAISGARIVTDSDGALLVPRADNAPITVTTSLDTRAAPQTQWAAGARLRSSTTHESTPTHSHAAPTLTLELRDVTTLDPEGRVNAPKESESYSLLTPLGFDPAPLLALPVNALLEHAARTPALTADAASLQNRIQRLIREIDSKLHERAAYAASCIIMVLLGAIVAMRLKDAMLLPVYLWSFLPALAAVITISAGQGLTHKQGPVGLLILWGGVAILTTITLVQYRTLRRH